ncbi:MAG: nucleotidyltransferase substrate binding protein [Oligoflexia bacterium]|nr:nucleotidyltransferase substrate binding protein [Oligoflexia bacterium]
MDIDKEKQDVRWVQRFNNFNKALGQLTKFIEKKNLSELEQQGLIKVFEYTYELAWNTLKDFFEMQGEINILGSRDAFRLAFKRGLLVDGEVWMSMVSSRILTVHTYNQDVANEIAAKITTAYHAEFIKLQQKLQTLVK